MPFRDIVGHRQLVALLARSVKRQALPPSLIFAGQEGIGKRTAALAVAQALNCLSPQAHGTGELAGVDACGRCAACSRIARGVHPDILMVAPGDSGSIKIDAIREMIDRSSYRPFEGRRRVVIIDEADALVVPAQNALLKTLEEPPPSSAFVLVTARPDALLATVRSRCPRLRFAPLSVGEIAGALVARGWKDGDAHAVAATADGSLARALQADAADVVESRDVARQVLGDVMAAGDPRRRLESAKGLVAKGSGSVDRSQLASHLRAMASLLRDAELMATSPATGEIANADVRGDVDRLARAFGGDRALRAFAAVERALRALDGNAGVKIVADWLVLQL